MWKKKEFIQLTFHDQTGKQKRVKLSQFLAVPPGDEWQKELACFVDEGIYLDRRNRCTCLNSCHSAQHVEMRRTSIFEVEQLEKRSESLSSE